MVYIVIVARRRERRNLIERLREHDGVWCSVPTGKNLITDATTALSTLQVENEKLRAELEQVKRCIEIVEKQRDAAIEELENYMVQDVLGENEPCGICAKASDAPCEYCDPKWRGPEKED